MSSISQWTHRYVYQRDRDSSDKCFRKIIKTDTFSDPISSKLFHLKSPEGSFNFVIDLKYVKLLLLSLNAQHLLDNDNKPAANFDFLIVPNTFALFARAAKRSFQKEQDNADLLRAQIDKLNNSRPMTVSLDLSNLERVKKSSITPRLTSHPRLAAHLLISNESSDCVTQRRDHVAKSLQRLDASVGTLITETTTGTCVKHSPLVVLDYAQSHRRVTVSVIGCPDLPAAYSDRASQLSRFLIDGFDQLKRVAALLFTEPVFGAQMTKERVLRELESASLVFLSTYSSNESVASLICSVTAEHPSSSQSDTDRYCKLSECDGHFSF